MDADAMTWRVEMGFQPGWTEVDGRFSKLTMLGRCVDVEIIVDAPVMPHAATRSQFNKNRVGLEIKSPCFKMAIRVPNARPPIIPRDTIPATRANSKRPSTKPRKKNPKTKADRTGSGTPTLLTEFMNAAQAKLTGSGVSGHSIEER